MPRESKTKKTTVEPPEELEGEALLAFCRVRDALAAENRLSPSDLDVLTLYARTHAKYVAAMREVDANGIAIEFSGGNPGLSPFFKATESLAKQLRTLLNDMGLTPATRKAAIAEDAGDLEI